MYINKIAPPRRDNNIITNNNIQKTKQVGNYINSDNDSYINTKSNLDRGCNLINPFLDRFNINSIYIINLRKNPDRYIDLYNRLVNLHYVNPNKIKKVEAIYPKGMKFKAETELGYGQLGCTLSHFMVWNMLLASQDDYCLVLEDDCFFNNTVGDNIQSIVQSIPDVPNSILYIGSFLVESLDGKTAIKTDYNSYWCRYKRVLMTHAYIVNRQTANILMENMYPPSNVIDHYIADLHEAGKLTIVSPIINLAYQFNDKYKSDLLINMNRI